MTLPTISIGFPPGPHALEGAKLAEELGFERLWLYDSAGIWEDVWMTLGMVAQNTSRIQLGTAVLVPNLRHVMTTASAVLTMERMWPGRLTLGFGTGFTARVVLGQRGLTWDYTTRYLKQLRALLAGETVEIEGKPCKMIHHPHMAKARPVEFPLILSALGPKGQGIARELADGLIQFQSGDGSWSTHVNLINGTVLDEGEGLHDERVIQAAGPWWAMWYHGLWERSHDSLKSIPGGEEYLKQLNDNHPEALRHLAVHEGHATHINELDRILIDAAGDELSWEPQGWVGTREYFRKRLAKEAELGTTEIVYAAAGPDPMREIRAFADAAFG